MVTHNWLVYLTLLGTLATLLPTEIDAGCVCSEKGTDYCAACSQRRIVRPKQRHSDGTPEINISPIGDKCWCTKKMIEPAVLPKPEKKTSTCGCSKSSSSSSSSSSYESLFSSSSSGSYAVPQTSYVSSVAKDDSLPADPISVSLAIQAGKAIAVPEAKLAYGFFQRPVDGLPKIYTSSVQEENLYALNNDVITLKKKVATNTKKVEDEYPDADEDEANNDGAADDEDEDPRLTYKQLGYVAEEYRNPQFQEVTSSYVSSSGGESSVVRGKVSVDCGYRPGRIAPYRKSKASPTLGTC